MGARANYAICERDTVEVFYSHWGADTITEDIFYGPTPTESFIRRNERTEEWLDNVFAEGGFVLQKDIRRLTYFCSGWPYEADLVRAYESLLAENWKQAGWTVRRVQEWVELAGAAGVSADTVTAPPHPPRTIAPEDLGENLAKANCCAILSFRAGPGWEDKAIDFSLPGLLMNGPALIDKLSDVAGLEALRAAFDRRETDDSAKVPGDWIDQFCAIDAHARFMRLSLPEHELHYLPFIQAAWPGWTVSHFDGGVEGHFAHTERDTPPDLVPLTKPIDPVPTERPYSECVRLIHEYLADTEKRKQADVKSRVNILQTLIDQNGPVTAAPGFLRQVPASQPGIIARFRLLIRLWRARLRGV